MRFSPTSSLSLISSTYLTLPHPLRSSEHVEMSGGLACPLRKVGFRSQNERKSRFFASRGSDCLLRLTGPEISSHPMGESTMAENRVGAECTRSPPPTGISTPDPPTSLPTSTPNHLLSAHMRSSPTSPPPHTHHHLLPHPLPLPAPLPPRHYRRKRIGQSFDGTAAGRGGRCGSNGYHDSPGPPPCDGSVGAGS